MARRPRSERGWHSEMGCCRHCGRAWEGESVGFHDACPVCGKPLHSCENCAFYAPGAYHDCREAADELVVDKEKANFCESFRLGTSGVPGKKDKDAARAKAEALFTF